MVLPIDHIFHQLNRFWKWKVKR